MAQGSSSEHRTLSSAYDITIKPPNYDKCVVEFILRKCYGHVLNSKGPFTVDTVTDETCKFSDIEPLSRSVASALSRRGLVKSDTVICASDRFVSKCHILFLGIWRANGSIRTMYPDENEETLVEVLSQSNCRWVICDEDTAPKWLSASQKAKMNVEIFMTCPVVEGCTSIDVLFQDNGFGLPPLELRPEESILMLPTKSGGGGGSGRLAAACYTNESLINAIQMWDVMPMVADPRQMTFFVGPMTHCSAVVFPLGVLTKGISVLLSSRIDDMNIILKGIHRYRPQGMLASMYTYQRMISDPKFKEYDLSSLEYLMAGGSPLTHDLLESVKVFPKLKNVSTLYAMTECVMIATSLDVNFSQNFVIKNLEGYMTGSVGKLLPHTQMEVRDLVTGKPLGPENTGELCFKSSVMFAGYLNNSEKETNGGCLLEDGWLVTGDIGYYDQNGFIYIVDERKLIFKVADDLVSPIEIEEVIRSFPAVDDVCVVAVPDRTRGFVPRAFVTVKANNSPTPEEIKHFAHQKLSSYKHLRGGLFIVSELPRGKSGKICRPRVVTMPVPGVPTSTTP